MSTVVPESDVRSAGVENDRDKPDQGTDVCVYVSNLTPDRLHLGEVQGYALCLPPLATRYPLNAKQYTDLNHRRLRFAPDVEVEERQAARRDDKVQRVVGIGGIVSLTAAAAAWLGFNFVWAVATYLVSMAVVIGLAFRAATPGPGASAPTKPGKGRGGPAPPRWQYVADSLASVAVPTLVTVIGFGTAIVVSWHLEMTTRPVTALLAPNTVPALLDQIAGAGEVRAPVSGFLDLQVQMLEFALRATFLGLVITFPAAMYFTFEKQRGAALRTRFLFDAFRLDDRFHNVNDIRARYGARMRDVFGVEGDSTDESGPGQGFSLRHNAPMIISTLALSMAVVLVYSVNILESPTPPGGILPFLDVVAFALLGAYFYSLNLTIRGYIRGDLQPKTYNQIAGRVLKVLVLSACIWVVAEQWFDDTAVALLLAFVAGIVPNTILTWMYENVRSLTKIDRAKLVDPQPLTHLQGVDIYDRARLEQEGVTNIEAMVHGELVDLMLQTRIPAGRLVDWLDQAVLLLHTEDVYREDCPRGVRGFAHKVWEGLPSEGCDLADRLHRSGIRTASQLLNECRRMSGGDQPVNTRPLTESEIDTYCEVFLPNDPARSHAAKNAVFGINAEPCMRRILSWQANRKPEERLLDSDSIGSNAAHCHIPMADPHHWEKGAQPVP